MQLQPYHLRHLTTFAHTTEFAAATSSARVQRWFPVLILLAHKEFTDYQIGRLLGLKEEYESGFDRRG